MGSDLGKSKILYLWVYAIARNVEQSIKGLTDESGGHEFMQYNNYSYLGNVPLCKRMCKGMQPEVTD